MSLSQWHCLTSACEISIYDFIHFNASSWSSLSLQFPSTSIPFKPNTIIPFLRPCVNVSLPFSCVKMYLPQCAIFGQSVLYSIPHLRHFCLSLPLIVLSSHFLLLSQLPVLTGFLQPRFMPFFWLTSWVLFPHFRFPFSPWTFQKMLQRDLQPFMQHTPDLCKDLNQSIYLGGNSFSLSKDPAFTSCWFNKYPVVKAPVLTVAKRIVVLRPTRRRENRLAIFFAGLFLEYGKTTNKCATRCEEIWTKINA